MSRVLSLALSLAFAAWALAPSPAAMAEGGAGCDFHGACEVSVSTPASRGDAPSSSKPKQRASKPTEPPSCSAFSGGIVVPPGTAASAMRPEDRPQSGWIRVTCLSAGEPMWLWMDPGVNAESMARTLLARMQLQPITIGWTPTSPGAMGVVGVPTWLWVADPGRLTWGPATISAGGVSLTARVESVTWDMGNGDIVRCANKGTEWRRGMGAGPSPTCGYTYAQQGTYRVTATSHWIARWSGFGRSGQIPLALSESRDLDVGEIQVVVNG